jgi:D-aminopeptidase
MRTPPIPVGRRTLTLKILVAAAPLLIIPAASAQSGTSQSTASQSASSPNTASTRPRASDLGLKIGVLPAGPLDAITDVAGVEVGHTTIIHGDDLRTGVTAILPHPGNLYREKVPGAVFVGNAFGKMTGSTQVEELGDIETPILLTSTTSVPRVADALISYMLALPGNEDVLSINPVVGETNDGYLSDIRGRHITPEDVFAAIKNAKPGPVEEGAVGAGTGTVAFGWKGGIGTASRRLPPKLGGYTVGVLVQTNYGGVLTIAGAPVGRELGQYYLREELQQTGGQRADSRQPDGARTDGAQTDDARAADGTRKEDRGRVLRNDSGNGSVMIVVATDAPLDARNLKRLAARAWFGVACTGSSASNGSGDYAIAFSSAEQVRIRTEDKALTRHIEVLTNDAMSPLFEAAIEATEEAVYNSMLRATTTTAHGHTVEALPIEKTTEILRKYGAIK